MLQVNIEKILPVTEARDSFNKIVDEVEGTDEMYVLTKNGKPAAVVVGVNHLEKLTGENHDAVLAKVSESGSDNLFSDDGATENKENPFETGAGFADTEAPLQQGVNEPVATEAGTTEVAVENPFATTGEEAPDIQKESEDLFFNDTAAKSETEEVAVEDASAQNNPFAVNANQEDVGQNNTAQDDQVDGAGPVLPT